jgi:succinate dehydrogenase / fumarate reductase iron-sulfur subunit
VASGDERDLGDDGDCREPGDGGRARDDSGHYDSNCLEEICGSCAMRINGKARMACSALVDNLEQPIKVEPLSKFPLVRDLQVDRSVLFENLKAVKAWVPVDGTYDLGAGPRVFPQQQEVNYPLSNCISCTCCMEVCPQFNEETGFVGAATIAQVKLFNNHPTGKVLKEERLRALAGDGGIQECGFAQNCVEACPKQLPLTNAISDVRPRCADPEGQGLFDQVGDWQGLRCRVQPLRYGLRVLGDHH